MRKEFVNVVSELFEQDENLVLLLGDIGVFGFNKLAEKYPKRCMNVGILEQAMVGMASGLSLSGLNPILHTIAPFLTSRVHEQLRIDFGYQKLNGNFVSVGGSYDYSSLGATHQAPDDVGILKQIPNFEIVVPGNSKEFNSLFKQTYKSGNPTYFRLCEEKYENKTNVGDVKFGEARVIKYGNEATVVAIGNTLDKVIEAWKDRSVTILYYTTVSPFDFTTLKECMVSNKILLVEPYYEGGLMYDIVKNLNRPLQVDCLGIPHKFLEHYGTKEQHDIELGFTVENIRSRLDGLING